MGETVTPMLTVDGLTVDARGRAGASRILQDVNFTIAPGEALGLVGESGCGKSTVALAVMHYLGRGLTITSGHILFGGRDVATLPPEDLRQLRGNRIAMVYQDPMSSLNPVMTIGRQLIEVPMLHGETNKAAARDRAIAMLGEVRLSDAAAMMDRYPHQLSGGQQQRVVIAMALMARPTLLVMDEPTTGLDVTIEAAILDLVRDLRQKFGTAILFISHNLGTVTRICDRIGVLYAGRLVEVGTIQDVFKHPAHPYTRGLLAALPRPTAGTTQAALVPITGTLIAADRSRIGCAFAPRCSFADAEVCSMKPVPLVLLDNEHRARCARLAFVAAARPAAHVMSAQQTTGARGPIRLTLELLSKRYDLSSRFGFSKAGRVHALTDASMEARAGETLAIVGESGSGKSTLAKIVSGLIPATSGHAYLAQASAVGDRTPDITAAGTSTAQTGHQAPIDVASIAVDQRAPDLRRRVQMVFQNPDATLNPSHSIEFALMRPLRKQRGLSKALARAEVAVLMHRVRLPLDLLRCKPHQLSGGQRQRVAVARALAGAPDLIIADEPVSALDVSVQAAIVNLLAELLSAGDLALVLISHDLTLVRHMADRVAVMYLGRVVEYGPAAQVFAPPFHPYTEALLEAVPQPDPDAAAPRIVLGGAMPSPTESYVGCVFASRCPQIIEGLCAHVMPPVRQFGWHTIRCHLEFSPSSVPAPSPTEVPR
jgi:peptide/nickel transport system ATP-binding protein